MKKALLLFWAIPIYLTFLTSYELITYLGLNQTYKNGDSIVAQITNLKLKNMQAQSNGILDIKFSKPDGSIIEKRMTLPIQLAAQLQSYNRLPIRYLESSSQPIVFMPTFEFHKNMVLMNFAITFLSTVFIYWVGYKITQYALRKTKREKLDSAVSDAWEKQVSVNG